MLFLALIIIVLDLILLVILRSWVVFLRPSYFNQLFHVQNMRNKLVSSLHIHSRQFLKSPYGSFLAFFFFLLSAIAFHVCDKVNLKTNVFIINS